MTCNMSFGPLVSIFSLFFSTFFLVLNTNYYIQVVTSVIHNTEGAAMRTGNMSFGPLVSLFLFLLLVFKY